QDFIKEDWPWRMIVRIDEAGHDRHLPGVERLGPRSNQRPDLFAASDCNEAPGLDRESFGPWSDRIDGIGPGVEDNQIGFLRSECGVRLIASQLGDDRSGQTRACQAHELSAVIAGVCHRSSNLWFALAHDPEKWVPVFRKDHAPIIS